MIIWYWPAEYFGHTTVGDTKLSTDVTGAYPLVCQLHNPLSYNVGQGAPIDEYTSELVHSTMTWSVQILCLQTCHGH